jgi:hypothetical protein
MSAWLGWLIFLAAVTVWLGVGFGLVAPRWITADVERSIREWPRLADNPGEIQEWRREAMTMCWGPALIWPLMFVRLLAVWSASRSRMTRVELERRIEQLEREAGIR